MTTTVKVPDRSGPKRVELVRAFFDQPQNYLERKRFDMRIRAETTRTLLEGRRCERIIDIGCGDGSVSLPLLSPDRYLTLVDISPNMLSLARSRVPADVAGNVEFMQEDFLKARLENETYHAVICLGVLAHVASPSAIIKKAAALLKPQGILILECTDSLHLVRRFLNLYGEVMALCRRPTYAVNSCSGAEVLDIAEKLGLELTATFRYSWPPPGSQRIVSQDVLYRLVRIMFGDVRHNRNQWLGYEHIFCLLRH